MRMCCSYAATGMRTRAAGLQSHTHTDGQRATIAIALQTSVQHSAHRHNLVRVRAQQRHKLRRRQWALDEEVVHQ